MEHLLPNPLQLQWSLSEAGSMVPRVSYEKMVGRDGGDRDGQHPGLSLDASLNDPHRPHASVKEGSRRSCVLKVPCGLREQ